MCEMQTLIYWPDGTWFTEDEATLEDYSFMSDDFVKVEIPLTMSADDIDAYVYAVITG